MLHSLSPVLGAGTGCQNCPSGGRPYQPSHAVCLCLPVPVHFPAQLHSGQDLGGTSPGFIRDGEVRPCCALLLSPPSKPWLQDRRPGKPRQPSHLVLGVGSAQEVVPCSMESPALNKVQCPGCTNQRSAELCWGRHSLSLCLPSPQAHPREMHKLERLLAAG